LAAIAAAVAVSVVVEPTSVLPTHVPGRFTTIGPFTPAGPMWMCCAIGGVMLATMIV
jgi:hypothetical protein